MEVLSLSRTHTAHHIKQCIEDSPGYPHEPTDQTSADDDRAKDPDARTSNRPTCNARLSRYAAARCTACDHHNGD